MQLDDLYKRWECCMDSEYLRKAFYADLVSMMNYYIKKASFTRHVGKEVSNAKRNNDRKDKEPASARN